MFRVLLEYAVPFLLPTAIYVGWMLATRRRNEAVAAGLQPSWNTAPWLWLALAGLLLSGVVLFAGVMMGGDRPGGRYQSPRLIDGQVDPGHVER